MAIVKAHAVVAVEINQSRVKCPMVGRRKRDPIPHMIHASGCPDREDVRRIHETKLHTRHRAAVAIGEEHLLAEAGKARKSAHLLDNTPAWRGQ